ncbi:MAG: hypothetical protein WD425_09685 [Nitrospirales bacterium]
MPFEDDSCFWEIFEHGRRVLFAAHRLRRKIAPHIKSPWGPEHGLKQFRLAWQRTQEMRAIWQALFEAALPSEQKSVVPNTEPSVGTLGNECTGK